MSEIAGEQFEGVDSPTQLRGEDDDQKRKRVLMKLYQDTGEKLRRAAFGRRPDAVSKALVFARRAGNKKLPHVLRQIEASQPGKLIIFAHHRSVLDGVEAFLREKVGA